MKHSIVSRIIRWLWHHHQLRVIFVGCVALFVLLSLLSYSADDATFFSYNTAQQMVHNWCGFIGATIAAFCVYCWGSACYALLLIPAFYIYTIITHNTCRREWDRFIAATLMPCVLACLLNLYNKDFLLPRVPGGFIGYHSVVLLYQWCDYIGALLLIHTLFVACLMVLMRHYFVKIILHSVRIMHYGVRLILYDIGLKVLTRRTAALYRLIKKGITQAVYVPFAQSRNQDEVLYGYDTSELDFIAERSGDVLATKTDWPAESMVTAVGEGDGSIPEDQMPESFASDTEDKKLYTLPDLSIFIGVEQEQNDNALLQELEKKAVTLQEKLERFGIQGKVVSIKRGPVVTLYEYQPHIDAKVSKIIALEDDLALALQAMSIRIIAPIPGKSLVGFEIANKHRKKVSFAHLVNAEAFSATSAPLPLIIGEDTVGAPLVVDLARMPHLLMAGSTGSGKSVALNTMLISLLCKHGPDDLKLILIDPKRLEFAPFADIAHLLFPIVTDPRQAGPILRWVIGHMEDRYTMMAQAGVRNITDYRARQIRHKETPLPYLVVVIDELADLMITVGREVEDLIIRITQMARAAGIHLIAATQRPSVDVITGLIKVNFPSRISFRVTSKMDSRTILDCIGADKLLGSGDMLFLDGSSGQLKRAHGAYVSDKEITDIVAHIRAERPAQYLDLKAVPQSSYGDDQSIDDELYQQILLFVHEVDEISISLLQRRFRIGYNRSARIIDTLEAEGLISPASSGRTRKVIR